MNLEPPIIQELESRVADRTRELSEVLDLNRTIINESTSGIIAFRAASGECVSANEAAATIVGTSLDNLLQLNFRQLKSWNHGGLYRRAEEVLASRAPSREEVRFVTGFGKEVWLDSVLTHFNSSGEAHLLLLMDDISERKQSEEALKRAKEAAESASVAKGQFLANMSHEIRTPMNAIVGLGQLALQTELSEKQRDYLLKILAASQSLLGTLNDILDFSKIEAGMLSIEATQFSLHDTLTRIAGLITVRSAQKGLEILYRIDPGVPDTLVGDPHRLEQVLINLLGNAVKFTEHGQVILAVEGAAPQPGTGLRTLHFTVTDSGIGLSSGEIDKLFQPFTQSDSSTTRRFGGTGLGLSICSRLVQLMGGEISVSSEPGKGSSFHFSAVFESGGAAAPTFRSFADGGAGPRVLVADDNALAALLLAEMLQAHALRVKVVSNGRQALEELVQAASQGAEEAYRLVFLDWRMPDLDGLETARRILEVLAPPYVPEVIITTAFENARVVDQGAAFGVRAFLAKPVLPRILQSRLEDVFGRPEEEETGAPNRLRGARVLLAEDHPINQEIAKEILERAGASVTIAGNGHEAVQAVLQAGHPFDIVLMDIQMPVMDGFQATSLIRAETGGQSLPIIAMTANALSDERERCLGAGMNDHIAKPIDLDELFQVLNTWLGQAKAEATRSGKGSGEAGELSLPDRLQGFNLATGLKRVDGNAPLLTRLLVAFRAQHHGAVTEIRKALANGVPGQGAALLHMLTGLAGNLGAERVCAVLAELDGALQDGSPETVELLLVALQNELQLVFDAAKSLAGDDFPRQKLVLKGATEEITTLCTELSGLLCTNNMQALQLFDRLCPLLRHSGELERLKHQIDNLDFRNAQLTLEVVARESLPEIKETRQN
jgi:two-component system, sensor histidine kinase and response regulator